MCMLQAEAVRCAMHTCTELVHRGCGWLSMQQPKDAKHDLVRPRRLGHDCPQASALVAAMTRSHAAQRSKAQLARNLLHARSRLHKQLPLWRCVRKPRLCCVTAGESAAKGMVRLFWPVQQQQHLVLHRWPHRPHLRRRFQLFWQQPLS